MCVGQRLSADELPPTAAQTAAAVAQLPIAPEPLTAKSPPPASVPAHMLGPVPVVVIEIRVAASTGVERLRCRALPGCCNEVVPSHRHPQIVALVYSTRSGLRLAGGDLLQKAWFPEAAAPVAMVHGQPDGSCQNNAPTTNTIRQHRVWGPRCGSTARLPVVTNPLPHAPGRAAQCRRLGRQSVATTCFCTGLFRLQRWVAVLVDRRPLGTPILLMGQAIRQFDLPQSAYVPYR